MIRVGIIGAESKTAGELLRLLLHHPEVDVVNAFAPSFKGRAVSSLHRGLVGETELRFSDAISLDDVDLLFLASEKIKSPSQAPLSDGVKVITFETSREAGSAMQFDGEDFVPGLSEMFRKPLVRTANRAGILPAPVAISLIVLYPLALHLLLNDTLKITIKLPEFKKGEISTETIASEIEKLLNPVQLSFNKIGSIQVESSRAVRSMEVECEFVCAVSEEEIKRIYNDIYEDHNFSFIVRTDPQPTEVAGTQKCLIYVSKPSDDVVKVKAVADAVLRGGAGDAIHSMNLLFGLFEKTGLNFPAGLAFNHERHEQDIASQKENETT